MGHWTEEPALVVNGEAVSLAKLLAGTRCREQMEFLEAALDATLIRQTAKQKGLTLTAADLQRAADDFRASRSLLSIKAIQSWLEARWLTLEAWQEFLEGEVLAVRLRELLFGAKVEESFVESRLEYDRATVSRIVVANEGAAKELRAQITEDGADFHGLARRHSLEEVTRRAGGYVGQIRRADLEAVVQSSVFGAKPGDVIGPYRRDKQWHLLLVEELHPAVLDEDTRKRLLDALFADWLAEQRTKAKLETPLFPPV